MRFNFKCKYCSAKVYWLPDYLGENLSRSSDTDKTPSSGGGGGNEGDEGRGCPNGWLSSSQIGDKICIAKGSYPWIGVCYGDCVCDTEKYPHTSSNCKGAYISSGNECNDGTEHFTECEISCNLLTDKAPCTYGCKTYYSAEGCPSVCKECYTDNCRNREDNRTAEGKCEQYWQDCQSKCEIGETCVPNDCSSFTLTTVPANASYSSCTVGCGDNTTYYKIDECNPLYSLSGGSCVKSCSSGYVPQGLSPSYCGSSFANGNWVLGPDYNGYSPDGKKCLLCWKSCTGDYELVNGACVATEEDDTCEGVGTSCAYCKTWDSTCNVCTACCSTTTYPYTSSNCDGTLSGSYCTDTSGIKHYTTCTVTETDPCDGVTAKSCTYCKTWDSTCDVCTACCDFGSYT